MVEGGEATEDTTMPSHTATGPRLASSALGQREHKRSAGPLSACGRRHATAQAGPCCADDRAARSSRERSGTPGDRVARLDSALCEPASLCTQRSPRARLSGRRRRHAVLAVWVEGRCSSQVSAAHCSGEDWGDGRRRALLPRRTSPPGAPGTHRQATRRCDACT
jgi:hypothetical protein